MAIILACLDSIYSGTRETDPLLPIIRYVSVGLEKRSDVQSLSSPKVTVDSPVESQLQRASVERPAEG